MTLPTSADGNHDPISLALGDVNSDGRNDLIVGHRDANALAGGEVWIYVQQDDGTLPVTPSEVFTSDRINFHLRVADMNSPRYS